MELLTFINGILKYTFLSFITFYIFTKAVNYTNISIKMIIIALFSSIFMGILYSVLIKYIPSLLIIFILIILITFFITIFTNYNFEHSIAITFVSMMIGFSCYIISLFITSMIVKLPIINLDNQNPLILVICAFFEVLMIIKIFRIKRFSHGFSFLTDEQKINNFSIVGLILSGNLIILYSILNKNENIIVWNIGIIGFTLIIIGAYIWIKRNITLDYKDRMKNREIHLLEEELKKAQEKNIALDEEIQTLAMVNHKYSSRIKAAEQAVKKLSYAYTYANNVEFSNELSDVTDLINTLSKEYANETNTTLNYTSKLPKTNVAGIDIIFEHLQLEALKHNIHFDLKINCSVRHLIDNFISQSNLETLISDHIKDAIIAINYSNNTYRNICAVFEIKNNCYQFIIYDSGIDFEIQTLVELGLSATTTHKDDGGSGIGFLTTFKTLSECKASLIIEEICFKNSNFSKSITISFDGKSQYILRSNRNEEIRRNDIYNRIILEDLN